MRQQNNEEMSFDERSPITEVEQAQTTKDEVPFEQVATLEQMTLVEPGAVLAAADKGVEISKSQLSLSKRLFNWRTLVPLVIVLGLLAYTAQKLQINPAQTWAALSTANPLFFLAAFLAYYLSFPIRTLRWRLLLANVGYTDKSAIAQPRFSKLLEIVYISWFANAIVPAKLGDLYRAYLLREEAGVSATRTFGTILAERLLDLSVLLLLFLASILVSLRENLPAFLRTGLYITLAIVILGIGGLFFLRIFNTRVRGFVPMRFQNHYDQLQEGTLGSFKRVPLLIVLTVAVWLCEAGRFFFVALSLNLIAGSLLHIGATAVFIALGEALLTIVPFTGGGVGLVEGGMLGMLALFTSARNLSAAAVLLDRIISLFSVLLIGLVVFLVASGRRVTGKEKRTDA
ncbi:MAG TPA: lysylphosphatidylglycerol synthase transmembrane domain-containing protein [Ktedonobacteraceae bacterium]